MFGSQFLETVFHDKALTVSVRRGQIAAYTASTGKQQGGLMLLVLSPIVLFIQSQTQT